MRILGIDPGLRLTGYACIEGTLMAPTIVEAGVIRLDASDASDPSESIPRRLLELERDLVDLLDRVAPDAVAVEGLFVHSDHVTTAVKMAHARGVMLLTIRRAQLGLIEVKPAAVKKSLTGSGRATKAQMQEGVRRVFGLAEAPRPADVADALAIALCAMARDPSGAGAPRGLGAGFGGGRVRGGGG